MQQVKVINHLEQPLRGRFNGEDFEFLPGKAVQLSLEACAHIFGLGDEDKRPALNRLGLMIPGKEGCDYETALDKLDKISFLEGRTVFDDEPTETPEDEQTPPPRAARGKTGGRPHVAGPGGEQAAGSEPAAANP